MFGFESAVSGELGIGMFRIYTFSILFFIFLCFKFVQPNRVRTKSKPDEENYEMRRELKERGNRRRDNFWTLETYMC